MFNCSKKFILLGFMLVTTLVVYSQLILLTSSSIFLISPLVFPSTSPIKNYLGGGEACDTLVKMLLGTPTSNVAIQV